MGRLRNTICRSSEQLVLNISANLQTRQDLVFTFIKYQNDKKMFRDYMTSPDYRICWHSHHTDWTSFTVTSLWLEFQFTQSKKKILYWFSGPYHPRTYSSMNYETIKYQFIHRTSKSTTFVPMNLWKIEYIYENWPHTKFNDSTVFQWNWHLNALIFIAKNQDSS